MHCKSVTTVMRNIYNSQRFNRALLNETDTFSFLPIFDTLLTFAILIFVLLQKYLRYFCVKVKDLSRPTSLTTAYDDFMKFLWQVY